MPRFLLITLLLVCMPATAQEIQLTHQVIASSPVEASAYSWTVLVDGIHQPQQNEDKKTIVVTSHGGKSVVLILSVTTDKGLQTFVTTATPGPSPNPVDPVDPVVPDPVAPDGDFAKAAQGWLKAVPAKYYSKKKALEVSQNYESVASQGGDPARSKGWTVKDFVEQTKFGNTSTISDPTERAAWTEAFFKPLALYQEKLLADAKVATTDTAGIAEIWGQTATAIKKGAF